MVIKKNQFIFVTLKKTSACLIYFLKIILTSVYMKDFLKNNHF